MCVSFFISSRRRHTRYWRDWSSAVCSSDLLALSAWGEGLNTMAGWAGVEGYPPAILFAVGLLFVIVVLLHYSTVISKLSDQNVVLAQRVALLEAEVAERHALDARSGP